MSFALFPSASGAVANKVDIILYILDGVVRADALTPAGDELLKRIAADRTLTVQQHAERSGLYYRIVPDRPPRPSASPS